MNKDQIQEEMQTIMLLQQWTIKSGELTVTFTLIFIKHRQTDPPFEAFSVTREHTFEDPIQKY